MTAAWPRPGTVAFDILHVAAARPGAFAVVDLGRIIGSTFGTVRQNAKRLQRSGLLCLNGDRRSTGKRGHPPLLLVPTARGRRHLDAQLQRAS